MFKKAIKARYMHELQGLGYDKEFTLENLTASKNPGELLEFLKKKQEEIAGQDQEKEKKIKSLIRKVSSFGYHFAKIDIRHTAVDLAKIDEVLGRLAIVRQKEFQGQGDSV